MDLSTYHIDTLMNALRDLRRIELQTGTDTSVYVAAIEAEVQERAFSRGKLIQAVADLERIAADLGMDTADDVMRLECDINEDR